MSLRMAVVQMLPNVGCCFRKLRSSSRLELAYVLGKLVVDCDEAAFPLTISSPEGRRCEGDRELNPLGEASDVCSPSMCQVGNLHCLDTFGLGEVPSI